MATVSSKDYREFIEEKEKEYLSPYAALSVNTRGRERPMKPCPIRTDYIRDRDRIIHCKSFGGSSIRHRCSCRPSAIITAPALRTRSR